MASSGSIWVSLGLKTDQFSKGVSRARKDLNGFQKFGAGMKQMFNPLTIGIGAFAGIGVAVSGAVKIFNEFEKANSQLKAVSGATVKEMEAMSTQAKALGASTAFTASQVTELQTNFARLGFPVDSIKNMTEATLNGAAALGSDLGEQAALTGAVLNSFGLSAEDAGKVNDVLAQSAASSALDFGKLATALPIVGSVAKATGRNLEQTTSILGVLTSNGLDASSSATSLRNIFVKLSAKGLTMEQALKKINESTDKSKTSFELFGKTSVAAGVILAEQGETVAKLTEELENSDGAAKQMAATMLDNVAGDVTKANSAYEGFILSLEDGNGVISDSIRNVTQLGTAYLSMLTILNESGSVYDKFVKVGQVALGRQTKLASELNEKLKEGKITQEQFNAQMKKLEYQENLEKNAANIDVLNQRLKDNIITQEQYDVAIKKLATGWQRTSKEVDKGKNSISSASGVIGEATEETKELTKAQLELAQSRAKMAKEQAAFVPIKPVASKTDALPAIQELNNQIASDPNARLKIPAKVDMNVSAGVMDDTAIYSEMGEKIGGVVSEGITAGVAMGFSTIGEGLGTALAGGDVAAIGQQFLSQIAGVIDGIGKQMIALGTAAVLAKESVKTLFANPAGAIAGGIGLVAVAAAMNSLLTDQSTGFAQGGLVTGSVFANVGEGRGTTRANPEVISPLDKLQSMIGGQGGVGLPSRIELFVEGGNLVKTLQFNEKLNKYS